MLGRATDDLQGNVGGRNRDRLRAGGQRRGEWLRNGWRVQQDQTAGKQSRHDAGQIRGEEGLILYDHVTRGVDLASNANRRVADPTNATTAGAVRSAPKDGKA